MTFQSEKDGPITDALVIENPSETSVIPGGASPDVMRAYSFVPSYVFYSNPGCWEFVVRTGDHEVRIVREMKPAR